MIEPGRAIQLRDKRRQLDPKTPLVGTTTRLHDGAPPLVPPTRRRSRKRLDDEHAIAVRRPFDEPPHERLTRRVVADLVDRERRHERRRRPRQDGGRDVVSPHLRRQPEHAVGPGRFRDGPRMTIDADDRRRCAERPGPRGACGARSAAEIDERRRPRQGAGQRPHDFTNEEVMERTVEDGERRALAGPGQRGALGDRPAALDVGR